MEWQPIETVKKSLFEVILLAKENGPRKAMPCYWDGKNWKIFGWDCEFTSPTHWMPLPEPPK